MDGPRHAAWTGITKVADLKGKRVAATRGTDPHIFLVRALAGSRPHREGRQVVILQHGDGKLALLRGDVDAWAGLDPLMASAEVENGAKLFFATRTPTPGACSMSARLRAENPEIVSRVLATYEKARQWSLANPKELQSSGHRHQAAGP